MLIRPLYRSCTINSTIINVCKTFPQSVCFSTTHHCHSETDRRSAVQSLLLQYSTKQYHIEYSGYLFNHVAHGIIALDRLGAPFDRLVRFAGWYRDKRQLLPAEAERRKEKNILSFNEVANLLGKGESFYGLLSYYEDQLQNAFRGDLDKLVQSCFPLLSHGMVGAAFHGINHLGYCFSSRCPLLVCEGLAYLQRAYIPVKVGSNVRTQHNIKNLGKGTSDIISVVGAVISDESLHTVLENEYTDDIILAQHPGSLAKSAAKLLTHGSSQLLRYVHSIKFPDTEKLSTDKENERRNQLLKWIIDSSLTLFLSSEAQNDFFLLHGVTAAWSLRQLAAILNDRDQFMSCIETFLCSLFAVYLIQSAPRLTPIRFSEATVSTSWGDIIHRALAKDFDEHVFKLVQVCFEMDQENTDSYMSNLYKEAANRVLQHPLTF